MEFLNKKEQTYEINKSFKFLNKIEKKNKKFFHLLSIWFV